MFTAEYEGINSFLVGASSLLLKEGIKRKARGFNCIELPEPFMFKLKNPTLRLVTIKERKWNCIFLTKLTPCSYQIDPSFRGN